MADTGSQSAETRTARRWFLIFKWTVYALLAVNTVLFFQTKPTLTAFIDGLAWIALLAVMEYESSSLGENYASKTERRVVVGITALSYGLIVYAWYGYIVEEEWLDVVNATGWLGVCAVLFWQIYSPGDYEGAERKIVNIIKAMLYAVLVVCALVWTIEASKPLDAFDAWLWLICFAVIELNVFGFDQAQARESRKT